MLLGVEGERGQTVIVCNPVGKVGAGMEGEGEQVSRASTRAWHGGEGVGGSLQQWGTEQVGGLRSGSLKKEVFTKTVLSR